MEFCPFLMTKWSPSALLAKGRPMSRGTGTVDMMNKRLNYAKLHCEATPRSAGIPIQASSKAILPSTPGIPQRCTQLHHRPSRALLHVEGKHHKRGSKCCQQGLHSTPPALLLLYDEVYKAWCPGVHRTSCSLSTGHRACLLWASMAVSPTASVHSFVGRFTATPWGYTNKLFGVEMLLRWEEAENSP